MKTQLTFGQQITLGLSLYILLLCAFLVYNFRHQIGITKPAFKVGECVELDISEEFNKNIYRDTILEVGKTRYRTLAYEQVDNHGVDHRHYESASDIGFYDRRAKKVECPDGKIVFGE